MKSQTIFEFGSVFTITLYSSFSLSGIFEALISIYGSPYLTVWTKAATPAGSLPWRRSEDQPQTLLTFPSYLYQVFLRH